MSKISKEELKELQEQEQKKNAIKHDIGVLETQMNLKSNISAMSVTDLKIYCLNLTTLGISFTQIDILLKVILVSISIGYTLHKWVLMYEKNKNKSK